MKIFSKQTLAILVGVFVLTFSVGAVIGHFLNGGIHTSMKQKVKLGKPVNVLLMGIDARGIEENSRSDTMILASIDPKKNKVAMVWVPRDTRVKVSGGRYDKINSVNFITGPEAACEQVSDLLGIDVDYYMVTNFDGFAEMVDTLGGVTIDVERDMNHSDPDPKLAIHLHQGTQKLDGADALRYVRFRGTPTADIGRTGRQQKFVKALITEMFQTKTILKLPELVPELAKNVHTNIPMSDMLYMVKLAKDLNNLSIITQTLPGAPYTEPSSGASYWLADEKTANGIVARMFNGEKFNVAQDPPSWVREERRTVQIKPPTEPKENADADAPMAEDAVLEGDFGGGDSVITGDTPSETQPAEDGYTTNGSSQDNSTTPVTPVQPDNNNKNTPPVAPDNNNNPKPPVSPDNNKPNSTPQPPDGSQDPKTGSGGY